ncbi:MAG: hypothetical protein J0G33_06725 [Afipia felis]|nr:hypothetical protein [Afipia felis]
MNKKFLNHLMAGVLGTALVIASPALAFRGGGGGGMHGGGMGGGAHFGGGGGMHFGAMGGGMHFGSMRFNGGRFAVARFAPAGFSPRISRFTFRDRSRFFHHRFHRFAFVGAPFVYASYYDSCWRRVWTPYGWNWIDVCGGYGYY